MLKRALVIAAAVVMTAAFIDDPVTILATLIWFGDEGQGHPKRRAALSGSKYFRAGP
jgi:hypothetical protein